MTEILHKNFNKLNSLYQFWICLALILVVAAIFWKVCRYDFIYNDDPIYVSQNPNIQAGITLKAVKWAFTTDYAGMYHPLTWLSHMLDWDIFGNDAGGHHFTNLVFHIANTLLLFVVLAQMTHSLWQSAFVAALFALHPLHVESVAWVSERKDVLSTFFFLLTLWAYVRFVDRPQIANYLLVVVFLACGLLSKPMVVTLPFVLLLLDYWPLDRVGPKRKNTDKRYSLGYLFIEKIPLFAMIFILGIVTFIAQQRGQAVRPLEEYSFPVRLANAFISYLQYIYKMIWPAQLAFFYPHPRQDVSVVYTVVSFLFLLIVTVFVVLFAKKHRYLVTGWFWYLGTLVPVIGLIQVGAQAMADRYSYNTLTGIFIIIAWGVPDLLAKWPRLKTALRVSSLVILAALAVQTYRQQQYWKDTITLSQHAIKVTNNNYIAYGAIADTLLQQNKFADALPFYDKALQIVPGFSDLRLNFSIALAQSGKLAEAVKECEEILLVQPGNAVAHNNLGIILVRQGKFDEAAKHFSQAVRINPDYTSAKENLRFALTKKRELQNKGNAGK